MENNQDCIVKSNPDRDFSEFTSKTIKFDKNFTEIKSDGIQPTLELQLVSNKQETLYQAYLVSSVSKKPLMLPIVSVSEEEAIKDSYNLLSDMLDSIADFMIKDSPDAMESDLKE